MRLVVFGSTGGTGRQIVDRALDAGHEVTAFARRPEAVVTRHRRLHVAHGDALEPAAVEEAVAGNDAVVSALGIGYSRSPTTVYSVGTANIIAAMRGNGLRRLTCVSTTSLDLPGKGSPVQWLFFRFVLQPLLRHPYADVREMESQVGRSDLDWSLIRAARLTNGPRRARYRTAVGGKLAGAWSISRADLAAYIVDHLDDGPGRATVEIAY